MSKSDLEQDINRLLSEVHTRMHDEEPTVEPEGEETETIHVFAVEGGMLILGDDEVSKPEVVESTPLRPEKPSSIGFYLWVAVCSLLIVYIVLGALFSAYLQPTATVTIIPDEQVLQAQQRIAIVERNPKSGQIQGQLLTRTLTWTKNVSASGRGHQNAAFAQGAITFYNGLLTAQSIPQGTILTGNDGREVVTDGAALIPPANPPVEGETTVPAHAVKIGTSGNIRARDIDEGCCAQGILAVNFVPFHGGADARDYTFVAANDIQATSLALTESLTRLFSQTLANSLQRDQSAIPPTCVLTTNTNHHIGDQVASMSVTVSGRCKSALYSRYALQNEAEILLAGKAKVLGIHYTALDGQVVEVLSQHLTAHGNTLASVMTDSTGVWSYQFSQAEEEHIKKLLRGKNRTDALKILDELAGVKLATITGTDPIPDNTAYIRIVFLYIVP